LDLARERRKLERASSGNKLLEISFLERATTAAIRGALVEGPVHVLHFMGHGSLDRATGQGVLFFESEDGSPEPVTGQALATKLKDVPGLGLVVLNACETARSRDAGNLDPFAGVANALVLGGLPAVVAMQFPVSDRAAIEFGASFYQKLAEGESVDEALTEGRQAIHSVCPDSSEWATPVLFLRVPDGVVFQPRTPSLLHTVWRRLPTSARVASSVVLALLLATGVVPPLRQAVWAPLALSALWDGGSFVLGVEQAFASTVEGVSGRLESVELRPDGKMRLSFRFVNSTGGDLPLDFQLGKSYLADELGNRYPVLDAGVYVTDGEPGGDRATSAERWFEFPTLRDGAHKLHVGLVSEDPRVEFPLFEAELGPYPEQLSVVTPRAEAAPGTELLEVSGAELGTDVEGFRGQVRSVELQPDGTMRWNLELFNRSNRDQAYSFRFEKIYLVDEFGNRYAVLGSSTGAAAGGEENAYRGILQRMVRADYWFEFPAPRNGARQFTVVFGDASGGAGSEGPRFADLKLEMPDYASRYTVSSKPEPPPPGAHRIELDRAVANNLDGLTTTLLGVDLLTHGRMRWRFALWNRSERDLEVGFHLPKTRLTDAEGRRYETLTTSLGGRPTQIIREGLERGVRVERWLEFPAPRPRAGRFTLALASHDRWRSPWTFPRAMWPRRKRPRRTPGRRLQETWRGSLRRSPSSRSRRWRSRLPRWPSRLGRQPRCWRARHLWATTWKASAASCGRSR
jgi:hypothetical protein